MKKFELHPINKALIVGAVALLFPFSAVLYAQVTPVQNPPNPGVASQVGAPTTITNPTALNFISQYPTGAIPVNGNNTGSTGAVIGTLPAAVGKTTFICGFNVNAVGGTGFVSSISVVGGGWTQTYQGSSTAAGGIVVAQTFSPCLPATAVNTAITTATVADGTATAVDVNSWGYQL